MEPQTSATIPSVAEADLALRQLAAIMADLANRDRYYKLGVCNELRKALRLTGELRLWRPNADFTTEQRAELLDKYRKLLLSL